MPTPFRAFAELCARLEANTGRRRKTELAAEFLGSVDEDEIAPAVLLLLGRSFPDSDARTLDVGYATISRAWTGDKQKILFDEELTLGGVVSVLNKIAEARGSGSRKVKEHLVQNLFGRLEGGEREYLARSLFGEMRTGVSEGLVLDAISLASGAKGSEVVRNAYMLSGDIAMIARTAITSGFEELSRISPALFTPIKPMLAESVESVEEALSFLGVVAFEYKLDGVRVQIHKKAAEVRIYSRRLTELSDALPEIVSTVMDSIKEDSVILEGEVVAYRDRPMPFQHVMRRITRVHEIDEHREKVPLRLYVFDVLLVSDQSLVNQPYEERWNRLVRMVPPAMLVPRVVTDDPSVATELLNRALAEGHEGLMAKDLKSAYAVGRRGRRWLKVKKSKSLDLVIIAAEWGHGRRRGWLSDYHLGAVSGEGYAMVGKTFKGLTDEEFAWMTERLLGTAVEKGEYVVSVVPTIVVEVAFDEIQESPTYSSGLALRFARIKSIRHDKDPREADTIETLRSLYESQFQSKDRALSPGEQSNK